MANRTLSIPLALALAALVCLAGFTGPELQKGAEMRQAPGLLRVSEEYNPCDIYGSSPDSYMGCLDRQNKIQRMENAAVQRDQRYAPQAPSALPPPAAPAFFSPVFIPYANTTPNLFNDSARAAAAASAADAQNRSVPQE